MNGYSSVTTQIILYLNLKHLRKQDTQQEACLGLGEKTLTDNLDLQTVIELIRIKDTTDTANDFTLTAAFLSFRDLSIFLEDVFPDPKL